MSPAARPGGGLRGSCRGLPAAHPLCSPCAPSPIKAGSVNRLEGAVFPGDPVFCFCRQAFPGKKTLGALPWAAVQSGSQRGAFSSAGGRLLVVSSRMDLRAGPCPVSVQSPRRAGGCGASLVGGRYARWVGRGQLPNDLIPHRPRPGGDGSRGSMCLHSSGRTDTRLGRPGLGIRSSGAARLCPSAGEDVGRGILSISLAVSGF